MVEDREREGGSAHWAEVPRALLEGFAVLGTLLVIVVGLWAFDGPTGPVQRQDFRQSMGVLLTALVGLGGLYFLRVLAATYERWRAGRGSGPTSEDARTVALARAGPRKADQGVADLSRANLRAANLRGVDLRAAILLRTDLREADLREADLRMVLMSNAVLGGADLREADLREANLRGVDLGGADLSGADLGAAFGWTEAQFRAAGSLEGATMPDGRSYEDWLKDEGSHREDGENLGPYGLPPHFVKARRGSL